MKKLAWFSGFLLTLIAAVGLWVLLQVPGSREIKGCLVTPWYHVHLCPGSSDYVPLSQISPFLQKAVVMSEDASFFTHQGFDWEELEKSAQENWEKGTYRRGGSTISQQLAKNMFLTGEKSLIRKGLEALITAKIEKTLSKKEILERYLNVVQFGKEIFGVKAAAKYYFQKSAADLDPLDSAFLAMLLPSPVKYASSYHKKSLTAFARKRIHRILTDLNKTGKITDAEYEGSLAKMETYFLPATAKEEELLNEPTADSVDGDFGGDPASDQQQDDVEQELPSESL